MVTVLVFPGQGAQRVGMARDLADAFPAARDVLGAIDEALGIPLSRMMAEGPEEALQQTDITQPAIVAHSAAVLAVVGPKLGTVGAAAGHSLGEYAAYMSSGALSAVEAARLVRQRGQLMHEAGTKRAGAMAVVLGLPTGDVERCCREASTANEVAVAANLNAPDQTVLSGDPAAVARAGDACKAAGAKRILPLKVSGAFHSPLMAPAAEGLRGILAGAAFADPAFPVVANATATPVRTAADARRLLADQLTAPVRWVECARQLETLVPGARYLEIGPGNVLGGLLKRILPSPEVHAIGTVADVEKFLA